MRASLRQLATATAAGSAPGLRRTPAALLPPIQLYRRVLRANRRLPTEMRVLGDNYVKSEFKQHKSVENPLHIIGFLTEWQLYAQKLEGDMWRGERLDKEKIDKMSDQQLGQLYELLQEIQRAETEEGGEGSPA